MKTSSFLAFILATVVAVGSTACGSVTEDQPADNGAATEDNLVEGEEVTSVVFQDVQGGNPQLTGVTSWDMLAIKKEGRQYFVFGGYDGYLPKSEHTKMEIVVEQGKDDKGDNFTFTFRGPDGNVMKLSDEQRKSVVADVGDLLKDAPQSALAIFTDPKTGKCKKGHLALPIKILMFALAGVSGLACGGSALVPMIGLPSCVVAASTIIGVQVLEKKAQSKCAE